MARGHHLVQIAVDVLAIETIARCHHELRVADDARKYVVEVVRDAARELADCFHLGGLLEL